MCHCLEKGASRAQAGSGHSSDGQAVVVLSGGHSQGSMLEILVRRPEED